MGAIIVNKRKYNTFGEYVAARRAAVNKTIRGLAPELDMAPSYLNDIEKDNRPAPENFLEKMIEALKIPADEIDLFYDLAGKSRNNVYPDLTEYIGKTDIARVALRRARDLKISDERWQKFINEITEE
ncbi:MAG: helix-turn-helix domain-containing protein [Oscillospiraceae bacterium]|nr:helix-turn-helix domain-containing protein [Oscillospiraceae bacterium]